MANVAPVTGSGGGTAQIPAAAIPTSGPVTHLEIYELLLGAGYSTAQAIGIMANAINESGLDPESHNLHDPTETDPNAQSFGLLQWNSASYPQASALVTGNAQADIRQQIAYLGQTVPQSALVGADGQTVAGNFAASFERCQGCQPGGAQWTSRRGNAATVAGWVTSGVWPTTVGGTPGGPGSSSPSGPECIISFPGVAGIGKSCLLRSSQARALIGGAMIALSAPVGLVGAVILAAFTFRNTPAGQQVGRSADAVGGAVGIISKPAGAAIAATANARAREAQAASRQRAASERAANAQARNDEAQYKRAASRKSDSASGRALRDDERLDPIPF